MNTAQELIPGLFRKEFSKMVAVISRKFGLQHIELAEDVVSETFLQAAESWDEKGIPPNPTAWLYAVAKQKTLHHFRRNKILDEKIIPTLKTEQGNADDVEVDFSPDNIRDSELQMMFAICDPVIAAEAQIALALRVLCGFSIDEIAEAFLTNKETINKRLFRAKEKLRIEKISVQLPEEHEIDRRLDNVLHIVYLLFNEGYYSTTHSQVLRRDLCWEALRLGLLLTQFNGTNKPKTNALVALMCFHSSRFDARENDEISFVLYDDQNSSLWNKELIKKGCHFLNNSAEGSEITSYHLEAGIAYWHSRQKETDDKWNNILELYDQLLEVNYSPSVALNRAYALFKAKGAEAALPEAEKLKLTNNHFYFTLLGELYQGIDQATAVLNFQKALTLAKTDTDRMIIQLKIENLIAPG
jgi:RNA polymerase sigma factor (sigma-70 family)